MNCPLFKTHYIEILETEIIYDDEDPSVGNLKIISYQLCPKEGEEIKEIESIDVINNSIEKLEDQSQAQIILNNTIDSQSHHLTYYPPSYTSFSSLTMTDIYHDDKNLPSLSIDCNGYCQSPLLLPSTQLHHQDIDNNHNPETHSLLQLNDLFHQLTNLMENSSYQISLSDIVFVHLYLSDISLFNVINTHYCNYFIATKYPPSRVCIGVRI